MAKFGLRRHEPPSKLRRRRLFSMSPIRFRSGAIVGSALTVSAVSLFLTYKAVERFPEYLGPVVPLLSTGEIVGQVTQVRDGDTIEVAGTPIRFGSLDCAERGTSDGRRAKARMRTLVSGQIVMCHLNGRTSHDRKIGSCRLQDGRDLGGIMIREGVCGRFF